MIRYNTIPLNIKQTLTKFINKLNETDDFETELPHKFIIYKINMSDIQIIDNEIDIASEYVNCSSSYNNISFRIPKPSIFI